VKQKLRDTESDRLPVQVNAYLDNTIDVQSLLEDSDIKTAALERVAELEEALSFVSSFSWRLFRYVVLLIATLLILPVCLSSKYPVHVRGLINKYCELMY